MNYVYFACRNSTTENACHPEACIQIQNVLIPTGRPPENVCLRCAHILELYASALPLPCALKFYTNIINISIQDISLFYSSLPFLFDLNKIG